MSTTKIAWTEETWNPVTGCTPASEGCAHCYAAAIAKRFWGERKFSDVLFHEDRLQDPLHWRKPRMVFVNSMSDLFHENVSYEQITRVFDVMASWKWPSKAAERNGDSEDLVDPGNVYQVLTKRPGRVLDWLEWVGQYWPGDSPINMAMDATGRLPGNLWLGVTCENQEWADKRIPVLLQIPAAVRFVSFEPLLGPVDLMRVKRPEVFHESPYGWHQWLPRHLHWVIVGCESGPGRRPCDPDWIMDIVLQCHKAGVLVFVKQMEIDGQVSHSASEIAHCLGGLDVDSIRQMPSLATIHDPPVKGKKVRRYAK